MHIATLYPRDQIAQRQVPGVFVASLTSVAALVELVERVTAQRVFQVGMVLPGPKGHATPTPLVVAAQQVILELVALVPPGTIQAELVLVARLEVEVAPRAIKPAAAAAVSEY